MDDWPQVDGTVLTALQQLYPTPLRLQAAFDNEEECTVLLHDIFPDMVDEQSRDISAELVHWQSLQVTTFKRMRRSSVEDTLYRLPTGKASDIHSHFTAITQSSSVLVLELAAKKKQRKYKEEAPDTRAKKADEERRKYAMLLANVIKSAKLLLHNSLELWMILHQLGYTCSQQGVPTLSRTDSSPGSLFRCGWSFIEVWCFLKLAET